MLPCEWKERGCARLFPTVYSMRVHQRSCPYQNHPKKKKRNINRTKGAASAQNRSQLRLQCDAVTFGNREGPAVSLPIFEPCRDKLSSIISELKFNDGIGIEKLSEEDSLLTSTMLTMANLSRKGGRDLVDSVLKMIVNPLFPMEKLRESCNSTMDCIKLEDSIVERELSSIGFSRRCVISDDETVRCNLYLRSCVQVLSKQIEGASAYSTLFNAPTNEMGDNEYCHPMTAGLGMRGESIVKRAVMSNIDSGGLWHDSSTTAEQSFAGMVQLYSDKSRTSLKESSFQFYPMHINLLNFSEHYRRKCIVDGMTVVAFLPTKFYSTTMGNQLEVNLSRVKYLNMLQKCMTIALDELKVLGLRGFSCQDSDGVQRRCHPVIASYCCDLPECKDILPIKNGNSSTRNCHRCLATSKTFNKFTTEGTRNGSSTVSLIRKAQQARVHGRVKEADTLLGDLSLIELIPFLHKFPFIGLDPILDMHIIFAFEPLHNLFLGISKLLKSCLSERLKSGTLHTSAISTKGGKTRMASFRTVRKIILVSINRMLSHLQRFSPLHGVRIDFSKSGSSDYEKGIYGSEGNLIGMLEGKDYRNLDVIFPFVGMFVDRVCDEGSTASSTKLFVQYIDMVRTCLSYKSIGSSLWNETQIIALQGDIQKFKEMAVELYSEFHASGLGTEKMHMLDHIADDIRRLGGLRYCDAGLYEYAHTMVKSAHKTTSKRRHTAMEETVSTYFKNVSLNALHFDTNVHNSKHFTKRSVSIRRGTPKALSNAIKEDCAALVSTGNVITVSEIDQVRRLIRRKRIASENGEISVIKKIEASLISSQQSALELVEDIGETASRILYTELRKMFIRLGETDSTRSDKSKIVRVASGYVSGLTTPTAENYAQQSNEVAIDEDNGRKPQRFVSTRNFYNIPGLRQDCILLQASETSGMGSVHVWFAKILGLFRISSTQSREQGKELAFVQFFDVEPLQDEIERALGCVRLRWARGDNSESSTGDDANQDDANQEIGRKWFSLVPVSTIRGVVHVIRGDYGIENRCLWTDMENVSWEKQHFYVNRFQFENKCVEEVEEDFA